jgi:hypothetical protein
MITADVIAALTLPTECKVDQRVPKKLLVENGAPTAADKRQINEGIDELMWLAALKPTTIGVPEYRDNLREYLEIAVLLLTLRPGAKGGRLMELIHRAIPYPVLLFTQQPNLATLSLVHKRWSQGEAGKMVLDGKLVVADLGDSLNVGLASSFWEAMPLSCQPRTSIYSLYQGWMEAVLALQIASVTGVFAMATSPADSEEMWDALQEYTGLGPKIAALRAAATKEKQISRQVEINLELKRLQIAQAALRSKLQMRRHRG